MASAHRSWIPVVGLALALAASDAQSAEWRAWCPGSGPGQAADYGPSLGWHFYCDRTEDPPQAQPVPAPPSGAAAQSSTARILEMRRQLEEARAAAILDPSREKVTAYLRLQQAALQRAAAFSDAFRRTVWATPELDYTLRRPVGALAKRLWSDERRAERAAALAGLSERYGLIYLGHAGCGACRVGALWNAEIARAGTIFGRRLFPGVATDALARAELLAALPAAHGFLIGASRTAGEIMRQQMVLNALHDAGEQWAAEAGNAAALSAYTEARAEAQTVSAYRAIGRQAETWVPLLRIVFECLYVGAFPMAVLLMLTPAGAAIFRSYVTGLVWLQSWGPLYAVLHRISMGEAAERMSAAAAMPGGDVGISLIAQAGIRAVASDVAVMSGYLSMSVPFLAAALAYGLSKATVLATSVLAVGQDAASSAAHEGTTGNLSLANTGYDTHRFATLEGRQVRTSMQVDTDRYTGYAPGGAAFTVTGDGTAVADAGSATSRIPAAGVRLSESLATSHETRAAEARTLSRHWSAEAGKQRARGASDAETLWSLIASLAAGNGALSDLDALREDRVGQRLLGLRHVPSGRRLGEYLARIDEAEVGTLLEVARGLARQVAPAVVEHEAAVRGYVPVFIDGTAIEVDGRLFEEARRGYDGTRQYWLHGVFIGSLWASGRLHPGGGDVAGGWREQLDSDVAPCLPEGAPVWLRADNAYYRGELIAYCRARGWDYSVSLTDTRKRGPVLDVIEGLPEEGWSDIGMGEDATVVRYRPAGWEEQSYVVIRRRRDRGQALLLPVYTVILVSRDDLPLDELVRRHRGKQGQENAFKGPLIDLDLHHPPCRRFRANQAFYVCGQIAQMLLRAVQYRLLPTSARRHGLRPLIRYLVRVVGRLVRSGRRWRLDFARNNFRLDWLYHAAVQLE